MRLSLRLSGFATGQRPLALVALVDSGSALARCNLAASSAAGEAASSAAGEAVQLVQQQMALQALCATLAQEPCGAALAMLQPPLRPALQPATFPPSPRN